MKKNSTLESTFIFALGGMDEIGKNLYCIEHKEEIILIDCGIKFLDNNLLNQSFILPSFDYLIKNKHKVKALLITHGHEDHIGGIPFLLKEIQVPIIYAPLLAKKIIESKIKLYKFFERSITIKSIDEEMGYITKYFSFEWFLVNHSIPDSYGIFIKTPNGNILTTGDFKFDWHPLGKQNFNIKKIVELSNQKVDLLLSDSTNSLKLSPTISEYFILENCHKIFKQNKQRIFFSIFASNINRIKEIIKLAIFHNRYIFISGTSIKKIINIISKLNHLKFNVGSIIKPISKVSNYEDKNIFIICTGSQGEENSTLWKLSKGVHKDIKMKKNDNLIISASTIPGNEEKVEKIINKLNFMDIKIYVNNDNCLTHVSGHASKYGQQLMISLVKPKYFLPMHGELHMFKEHKNSAINCKIDKENIFFLLNGEKLELTKNIIKKSQDRIFSPGICVKMFNMNKVKNFTNLSLYEGRQKLSKHGFFLINLLVDSRKKIIDINFKCVSINVFNYFNSKFEIKTFLKEIIEYFNKNKIINLTTIEKYIKKELKFNWFKIFDDVVFPYCQISFLNLEKKF